MERCANTEALNRHLAEQEQADLEANAIEEKITEVEERFTALAKADGLDEACYWLAGAFKEEAIDNAADIILNVGGPNNYFEQLILAKAEELLKADQYEPDAPDHD